MVRDNNCFCWVRLLFLSWRSLGHCFLHYLDCLRRQLTVNQDLTPGLSEMVTWQNKHRCVRFSRTHRWEWTELKAVLTPACSLKDGERWVAVRERNVPTNRVNKMCPVRRIWTFWFFGFEFQINVRKGVSFLCCKLIKKRRRRRKRVESYLSLLLWRIECCLSLLGFGRKMAAPYVNKELLSSEFKWLVLRKEKCL